MRFRIANGYGLVKRGMAVTLRPAGPFAFPRVCDTLGPEVTAMRVFQRRTLCCLMLTVFTVTVAGQGTQPRHKPDVPYVPTTDEAGQAMLKLAGVQKSDNVYDLGCGDGRIVIAAAKNFGAHGVGIDIDPVRIREATANAQKA